jgi:ubiquitin C-terminal hydrolase
VATRQELLIHLLDGIHEDLNEQRVKPATEIVESDGTVPDVDIAREAWRRHLLRNKSIVVDMFQVRWGRPCRHLLPRGRYDINGAHACRAQGQYRSKVVCPDCGKVSITFDPYMNLSGETCSGHGLSSTVP